MITVITLYRGHDAETFTQVVEGQLTKEQRTKWRLAHNADQPGDEDKDTDDINAMFFCEFTNLLANDQICSMPNADSENKPPITNPWTMEG